MLSDRPPFSASILLLLPHCKLFYNGPLWRKLYCTKTCFIRNTLLRRVLLFLFYMNNRNGTTFLQLFELHLAKKKQAVSGVEYSQCQCTGSCKQDRLPICFRTKTAMSRHSCSLNKPCHRLIEHGGPVRLHSIYQYFSRLTYLDQSLRFGLLRSCLVICRAQLLRSAIAELCSATLTLCSSLFFSNLIIFLETRSTLLDSTITAKIGRAHV